MCAAIKHLSITSLFAIHSSRHKLLFDMQNGDHLNFPNHRKMSTSEKYSEPFITFEEENNNFQQSHHVREK